MTEQTERTLPSTRYVRLSEEAEAEFLSQWAQQMGQQRALREIEFKQRSEHAADLQTALLRNLKVSNVVNLGIGALFLCFGALFVMVLAI